jgi:VanZ family protein
MRHFLKYWLPLLIWVGVVFLNSTDLMSAEHTSRFILPILYWLKPGISPRTILLILTVIRKCAHVTEFAVLAVLLFRAVISVAGTKWPVWMLSVCVWIGCLFVAITDEFHQSFVKSRTPSVRDVLLDSAGAILGVLISAGFRQRHSNKAQSNTRCEVVDARL